MVEGGCEREEEAGPVNCVETEYAFASYIFYLLVRTRMRGAGAAAWVCGVREAVFRLIEPDLDRLKECLRPLGFPSGDGSSGA